MAKGDHQRVQDSINTQTPIMQNSQNKTSGTLNDSQQGFQSNYNTGSSTDLGTYNDVMGKYNSLYNDPFGNGGVAIPVRATSSVINDSYSVKPNATGNPSASASFTP